MNELYLDLYDIEKQKSFRKYFECMADKLKFINKLKYSKKLIIIGFQPSGYYE